MLSSPVNGDARLLLSSFGLGHSPFASGTVGSIPPIVVAAIFLANGVHPDTSVIFHGVMIALIIIFSLVCVIWGEGAEILWGDDPSQVTADETAGMCIPLLFLPSQAWNPAGAAIFTLLLAFLAFRLFDVMKPWPASWLQRKMPGGWGILLDDLAAGAMALVLMQIVTRVVV